MPRYYVEMDGHAYGPFDRDELAQLRDDGILSGNSTAREEHSSDGVPLNQLLESLGAAPAAGAHAAPPGPEGSQPATPMPDAPASSAVPDLDASAPQADCPQPLTNGGFSAPPSSTGETWSERLSRLRSSAPPSESVTQTSAGSVGVSEEEDDGAWASRDAGAKPAPDFLLPENADIEEGIQYKSALREAESPAEDSQPDDGFLPSLGFNLAPPAAGTGEPGSSELPPLGGLPAAKAEVPSTWSTRASGSTTGPVEISRPAGIEPPADGPEQKTEPPAAAPSGDAAASDFEGPGPEWKHRMAQLDVIYGRPEGENVGRPAPSGRTPSSGAVSQAGSPPEGSAPVRSDAGAGSSPLLCGLAQVVVGGVALLAGWNYVSVPKGPALALAAAMAAYGGLSVNGGILVWLRIRWIAPVMRVLLLVPLAVALASCYYFREDLLNLVIPASLQKPLMFVVATMIVSAVGLASLPKRAKNAGQGA